MRTIPPSELPLNSDGSVYHLNLRPEHISDKLILVGDPARVNIIADYFDTREFCIDHREFRTITGSYKGKRITVLAHGMGTDNIDITLTELDALANIDLQTRTVKPEFKQLTMVRIGTSGGLQPHTPVGSYVIAEKSIGFDGVLNFYANRNHVCDLEFEAEFKKQVDWSPLFCSPYVVDADIDLIERIGQNEMVKGVTISANGFYGPQGREVRLPLAIPLLNEQICNFKYNGYQITNYEMESSAIAGLALLMGHKAMSVCCIIANRIDHGMNVDYNQSMTRLIETVLDRL